MIQNQRVGGEIARMDHIEGQFFGFADHETVVFVSKSELIVVESEMGVKFEDDFFVPLGDDAHVGTLVDVFPGRKKDQAIEIGEPIDNLTHKAQCENGQKFEKQHRQQTDSVTVYLNNWVVSF